jgi:hypothetical protein
MTTREDRRTALLAGRPSISGVPVRDHDIEPTRGLHWVAKLFRVLAGMMVLLMVVQIFLGVTSAVEISYGMLLAEAIRLLIFAGLLWGGSDLVELFVKSHYDLRASRIVLGRLTHLVGDEPGSGTIGSDDRASRGRGDATH